MSSQFTVCGSRFAACSLQFTLCLLFLSSCIKQKPTVIDPGKPKRPNQEYFDKKYLLHKMADDFYKDDTLNQSFDGAYNNVFVEFKPLGYDSKFNFQYTHIYSDKCVYHTSDSIWKFAEVCFPNTCLTKAKAYASAIIRNTSKQKKTFYVRLFYQNTT